MMTMIAFTCALLCVLCVSFASGQQLNCSTVPQEAYRQYVLKNDAGYELHVMPFGGTVTKFLVPDKDKVIRDIVLGFDDPTQYCVNAIHPYFGAIIGRYANRIANGSFTLDGKTYKTPLNDHNDTLHGGTIGFDRRVWDVVHISQNKITLSYLSPDGEMGFPGTLRVNVTYTLTSNSWVIDYAADTDSITVINLSQHTYWNLNGFKDNDQDILEHIMIIKASQYLEVDSTLIPTGKFGNVTVDYWLDFERPKPVGKDIKRGTVTPDGGYDNAFVLDSHKLLDPVVIVLAPLTGIQLELSTSQISVQFYSGNFLDGTLARKKDQVYGTAPQFYQQYSAMALEGQHYPDSVHHPNWPTTVLQKGQTYTQRIEYKIVA